jgi:benzoylformate decarboxylase
MATVHSAPGLGNAMGAIHNARIHRSPLIITAGQQARSLLTLGGHLSNQDAARMPDPLVKWSYEPPRAEDVPHALARAIQIANLPPKGPAFVSIPVDDWGAEVSPELQTDRFVSGRAVADPAAVVQLARRLESASNPALIAGADIDASGAWDAMVALAEQQSLPVWASPAMGSGRLGFPEGHPAFQGILPVATGQLGATLAGYDLVLVIGSPVFRYALDVGGPLLPDGTSLIAITSDPEEAARAPIGDAIVAEVALTLEALLSVLGGCNRAAPAPRPPAEPPSDSDPMSSSMVAAVVRETLPDDGILVVEAPTAVLALRDQVRLSRPGSFFYIAGGGLGWGLPAAIGIALAQPDRPVLCVIGDGATQYAIQGLWTAAAYHPAVTYLVLRNDEYASLKWYSRLHGLDGVPGLDLPGLQTAALASDYGIPSERVSSGDQLREALRAALASEGPSLIEARVAPGEDLL